MPRRVPDRDQEAEEVDVTRRWRWISALALLATAAAAALGTMPLVARTAQGHAAVVVRDVAGRAFAPFAPTGTANVLFFVQTDCPISNWHAQTIQRVCRDYAGRGVGCALMYEDVDLPGTSLDAQVRTHLAEFGHGGIPAVVDRARSVASRAKATITPQAVVVDRRGAMRYRGRIDNAFADFGTPRQHVTSHDLRDALDALLAGRPVPNPETQALGCFIVDPASLRNHHE
jgi:hypothetical protein